MGFILDKTHSSVTGKLRENIVYFEILTLLHVAKFLRAFYLGVLE